MKYNIILAAAAFLLAACSGTPGSIATNKVDPLYKVIPGDSCLVAAPDTIDVARGENACLQIVVTNTDSTDIEAFRAYRRQLLDFLSK